MSKTKNYTIKLSVEKQTGGISETVKELHQFMSTLMLINIPFRVYGMLLRDNHRVQQLLAAASGEAAAGISTEGGAANVAAGSLGIMNQQLATAVLLMGALSEGAAVPGMEAGMVAASTIVASAIAGGAAVPVLQGGGTIMETGIAKVERGEHVIPAGGGFGGDVTITNHISVDPAGMDLTDFTSALNEQMRLALRGKSRDIPI